MSGPRAYVAAPPPLVGRADALRELAVLAAARPGVIVVAGEPGAGATRVAREAAARLAIDGAVLIDADGDGDGQERLARALERAGHRPDLAFEARLRPMVAVMGDVVHDTASVRAQARRLEGSRALAIYTAPDVVPDTVTLELDRLSPEDSARLAAAASPEIEAEAAAAVGELGDGLPGRIVPLALAARRWPGGDAPLPIPAALVRWARERLEPLDPWAREIARWAAVAGTPTGAHALARVCRMDASHVERALTSLAAAGVMEELHGPPGPRWRFRDRLVAAALAAELGGAERRRRHAAALVSARSWGASPAELLRHAVGAADAGAVVDYGVRSAEAARAEGTPRRALIDADRAVAWWSAEMGPARRLAALHERGMALLDLSAWSEAAEDLEEAADGWRALRELDAALASASAASSARWSLGQHDAALTFLRGHVGGGREPGAAASAARAETLAQAAGMAVMTSRFADAVGLAQEARSEAVEAEADEVATRALIFEGMAESGRGAHGGLAHLARARREGERIDGAGQRNETLAMIHESHVLLALGRPDEAAARARAGAARARELALVEHELVLAGNLGEALAAAGELEEARRELESAAAGWTALGREAPSPADPGLAWLLYAEGRIDEALLHYRSLARVATAEAALFEQVAPVATGHALAASAAGAEGEALGVLTSAMGAWADTDDRLASIPLLAVVAEVGDTAQAARATAALAEMAAGGSPLAAPFHAVAEGKLAHRRGRPDAAAHLRTAAAGFTPMGMRWWGARSLFLAGSMDGRTERAAEDLLTARRSFREMGAGGWRRRAEARLRAIGRRIPTRSPLPSTPSAGLSARELEVLEQLSLGLRNRDIGTRLFISERTVARHLVGIYAKLGVSNRTSAVRAAHERGLIAR